MCAVEPPDRPGVWGDMEGGGAAGLGVAGRSVESVCVCPCPP